jgi:hypothetical protein
MDHCHDLNHVERSVLSSAFVLNLLGIGEIGIGIWHWRWMFTGIGQDTRNSIWSDNPYFVPLHSFLKKQND